MRGSLRVHNLAGLAAFLAWSLLAHARELVSTTPGHAGIAKTVSPRPRPALVPPASVDPKLWN
jgi:hypothetical protein